MSLKDGWEEEYMGIDNRISLLITQTSMTEVLGTTSQDLS